MGYDCCEPLPQSVGVKKWLGLRLSLSKPRRSQSESDDCSEPLSKSQGASTRLLLLWTRRVVKKVDGAVGNYSIYAAESLNRIRMEMTDAAFTLLKGVVATKDVVEACKDVKIAVMLVDTHRRKLH
ncbi:hypothetical protein SO802_028845 [Lithocarpus litseifolius]|uniref:Uncharacterized protein n=1 Tax=Lithocarpus litseifolius TaxID=425828 RepID=A0AAW2BRG3_9ROSI